MLWLFPTQKRTKDEMKEPRLVFESRNESRMKRRQESRLVFESRNESRNESRVKSRAETRVPRRSFWGAYQKVQKQHFCWTVIIILSFVYHLFIVFYRLFIIYLSFFIVLDHFP